jgi:hypothetical protein
MFCATEFKLPSKCSKTATKTYHREHSLYGPYFEVQTSEKWVNIMRKCLGQLKRIIAHSTTIQSG